MTVWLASVALGLAAANSVVIWWALRELARRDREFPPHLHDLMLSELVDLRERLCVDR